MKRAARSLPTPGRGLCGLPGKRLLLKLGLQAASHKLQDEAWGLQHAARVLLLVGSVVVFAGQGVRAQESASGTYDAKSKRDPFVPCVRDGRFVPGCGVDDPTTPDALIMSPLNPHFKLEAIVHDPSGSSLAIINDMVVSVGQRISDFEVKTIERDAVTLTRGTESIVIRITFETPPASSKTPDASKEQERPRGGEGE